MFRKSGHASFGILTDVPELVGRVSVPADEDNQGRYAGQEPLPDSSMSKHPKRVNERPLTYSHILYAPPLVTVSTNNGIANRDWIWVSRHLIAIQFGVLSLESGLHLLRGSLRLNIIHATFEVVVTTTLRKEHGHE